MSVRFGVTATLVLRPQVDDHSLVSSLYSASLLPQTNRLFDVPKVRIAGLIDPFIC